MILFVFKLFFSVVTFAQAPPPNYEMVDKIDFQRQIKKEMVSELCHQESYFVSCYQVTIENCKKDVDSEFDICAGQVLAKVKKVDIILEGPGFTDRISKCIAAQYYNNNLSKKSTHKSCSNRNWIKK